MYMNFQEGPELQRLFILHNPYESLPFIRPITLLGLKKKCLSFTMET